MATVEVVSVTSAFQDEKIEEPMNKPDQPETNTVKESNEAAAPTVPEATHEEPVKETESDVVEEPAAAEAETLAAEVETKVVVKETDQVITPEEPQPASAGGEAANLKVAPEPEPAIEEETIKEAEPADSKVETEEEEEKPADEADQEKVGNEAAEVDKSVE